MHLQKPLHRRYVAAALWPDVDYDVGGNRLRTALVALRKCLAPKDAVHAEDSSLQLNPDLFDVDLETLRRLETRLRFLNEPEDIAGVLDRAIALVLPGLLPGWEEDWLVEAQARWAQFRCEALSRRSGISLQTEDFRGAAELAREGLRHEPRDEQLWGAYLVAMAKLGEGAKALREFRAEKARRQPQPGSAFSKDIQNLVDSVAQGAYGPEGGIPTLPAGMDAAVARAVRRLIALDPEWAARFVCTDAFRLEILRLPEAGLEVLKSLLERVPERAPERTPLEIMTMRTLSVLHDVEGVVEAGSKLLLKELDPAQKRLVLAVVSFAYFLDRKFDVALDLVDQALDVAKVHSTPHHFQLTRADKALYLWHAGRDVEAQNIFKEVYAFVKDLPAPMVSYAPAYLSGLVGAIYLGQENWQEAQKWLKRGYSLARVHQYREHMHQIEPPYGYLLAKLGSPAEGAAMAISGLVHFCRSNNARAFAAGLDYVAGIFQTAGRMESAATAIAWSEHLRARCNHARSIAEQRFVEALLPSLSGQEPNRAWLQIVEPRQILDLVSQQFHQD